MARNSIARSSGSIISRASRTSSIRRRCISSIPRRAFREKPDKYSACASDGRRKVFFDFGYDTVEESVRRNLEYCGAIVGVACMIVAVDDAFVVPVPTSMKIIGFFRAASNPSIAVDARDDVVRKLADASSGWNAVAVGTSGRPGLAVKAASEQNAVNDALGNCVKHDSDCHVIAIGPFAVGPN
jgi:adenylate cyclase